MDKISLKMCLESKKKVDESSLKKWMEVLGWNWCLRVKKLDEKLDDNNGWINWMNELDA